MKHASASRAERRTNRDLLASAERAGEEQVTDVGAGDEEDQPDPAEQHEKHRAAIADDFLLHRDDHGFPASSVRLGKLTREPCGDRVHLGLRLRQFDISLQTRDAIPIVIPTGGPLLVSECERNPDLACHPGP